MQVCCSIDAAFNNFTQEKDFILQSYEWEFQVCPTCDVTGFQLWTEIAWNLKDNWDCESKITLLLWWSPIDRQEINVHFIDTLV